MTREQPASLASRLQRVFVIAEAGVNHNGDVGAALALVDAAAAAGADAVKFQTFRTGSVVTRAAAKAEYQKAATGADEGQFEMIRRLELGHEAHRQIAARCAERGIAFMSTPFDVASLRFLVTSFSMPFLKVPSGEITNAQLLHEAAQAGLPIILSTGMSTLPEIEVALGVLAHGFLGQGTPPSLAAFRAAYSDPRARSLLRERVVLLHCTTEYPAPLEDVNLRAMGTLGRTFGLEVGYSDHTQGIGVTIAATARGARVIEKHFTLSRAQEGPDHAASLEPGEMGALVAAVREIEMALGSEEKGPAPSEARNIPIARRSLVAARHIAKGDALSAENLTAKRPAGGVSAMEYFDRLGTRATREYEPDEVILQGDR